MVGGHDYYGVLPDLFNRVVAVPSQVLLLDYHQLTIPFIKA